MRGIALAPTCSINDWPTRLAAAICRWRGGRTPTVATITTSPPGPVHASYSPISPFRRPPSARRVEFYGRISFSSGRRLCDHVTPSAQPTPRTSPPEFGCGAQWPARRAAREGAADRHPQRSRRELGPRATRATPIASTRRGEGACPISCAASSARALGAPLFPSSRGWSPEGLRSRAEASEAIVARGASRHRAAGSGSRARRRGARRRHPHAVGARLGYDAKEGRAVFAAPISC